MPSTGEHGEDAGEAELLERVMAVEARLSLMVETIDPLRAKFGRIVRWPLGQVGTNHDKETSRDDSMTLSRSGGLLPTRASRAWGPC